MVVQQRAEKNEIKRLVRNVKQQNRLALKNIFCATLSMVCKNQSLHGIQYIYYVLHISGVDLGNYQHSQQAIRRFIMFFDKYVREKLIKFLSTNLITLSSTSG